MSAAAQDHRKYAVVTLIAFGLVASLAAAVVLFLAFAFRAALNNATSQTGSAHLNLTGPFSNRYAVSAVFVVPPDEGLVHSENSLQFEALYTSPRSIRIESGVTRSTALDDRLTAFVTVGPANRVGRLVTIARLSEGPHRVTMAVDGGRVGITIDGGTPYRFNVARFSHARPAFLTAGTYVGLRGERGAGLIADLLFSNGSVTALRPIVPACVATTHGLSLTHSPIGWTLSGVNKPTAANFYAPACFHR